MPVRSHRVAAHCARKVDFRVSIRVGASVRSLISEASFVSRWEELARRDGKFTALQEPAFVSSWYRTNETRFEPIALIGVDSNEQLVGLMLLARLHGSDALVHAGDIHADYSGWLALPEIDERFVIECLIIVKNELRPKAWAWNHLTPGSPIGFLRSQRLIENGIFASYRTEQSPILNLDDPERLAQLAKTKSIRNQLNRLKKKGGFRLERVRDRERTRQLMRPLSTQCDFRQEAIHNVRPFADNPQKEPFFLARQEFPESNHFSVLWSGGRPVSFQFGTSGKGTMLLGLTAYDPTESRNSPGKLHLIELAGMLREEGFRTLDLTPGGDQYKEFLSNGSYELVKPAFFFSRTARLGFHVLGAARAYAKKILAATNVSPEAPQRVISWVRAAPARLKRVTPRRLASRIHRVFHQDVTYLQYTIDCSRCAAAGTERDPEVHIQQFEDLLAFRATDPLFGRRDLLLEAMKRFSVGETLYSICREGRLAHYGWLFRGARKHRLQGVNATFDSPPDSAVLYGFFTDPEHRGRGLYQRTLRQILRDLALDGVRTAYIGVLKDNLSSRRAIEAAGFTLSRVYRRRRVLWMERTEETSCAEPRHAPTGQFE